MTATLHRLLQHVSSIPHGVSLRIPIHFSALPLLKTYKSGSARPILPQTKNLNSRPVPDFLSAFTFLHAFPSKHMAILEPILESPTFHSLPAHSTTPYLLYGITTRKFIVDYWKAAAIGRSAKTVWHASTFDTPKCSSRRIPWVRHYFPCGAALNVWHGCRLLVICLRNVRRLNESY